MIDALRARVENRIKAAHLIRQLLSDGHSYGYIAEALDHAGILPLSGNPAAKWRRGSVHRIAVQEGYA